MPTGKSAVNIPPFLLIIFAWSAGKHTVFFSPLFHSLGIWIATAGRTYCLPSPRRRWKMLMFAFPSLRLSIRFFLPSSSSFFFFSSVAEFDTNESFLYLYCIKRLRVYSSTKCVIFFSILLGNFFVRKLLYLLQWNWRSLFVTYFNDVLKFFGIKKKLKLVALHTLRHSRF